MDEDIISFFSREVEDSITFSVDEKEVMIISAGGNIYFPEGNPVDERAADIIKILEESIVLLRCGVCNPHGSDLGIL